MSTLMPTFHRHLSNSFLSRLHDLIEKPEGQWWRDVLVHRDLILAVRNDTLNVYYRGGSIFRVVLKDGCVVPETHVKYLVRQRQAYAAMQADGSFAYQEAAVWAGYEGSATLNEMIAAAKSLAGPEKTGLHALIKSSTRVIDVEIAFRSAPSGEPETADTPISADDINVLAYDGQEATPSAAQSSQVSTSSNRHDRLDAATLEERDGAIWIVFHEAKHFANAELRAAPGREPAVSRQIARYRTAIKEYGPSITLSYGKVCKALVALHDMRTRARTAIGANGADTCFALNHLVSRVAGGDVLHIDLEPRLIVFGFDKDQRDGPWKEHRKRLETEYGLTVYAVGNPSNGGSAAFEPHARQ